MVVTRYLSGAWAAVHGPAEPRPLLRWTLERGFQGLVPGPGPRARDWRALAAQLAELPVRIAAVRAAGVADVEGRADRGLASANPGERDLALQRVGDAVALAGALGCRNVILEPGSVAVPGESGPVDLGDPRLGWTADRARAQRARR